MNRRLIVMAVLAALVVAMTMPALAQDAAATYKSKCVMCHGADGKGNPAMAKSMQNLDLIANTKTMSEADVAGIIGKGKPPKMPAYGTLGDPTVQALAKYVKGLK